jgi:hypothetical protein
VASFFEYPGKTVVKTKNIFTAFYTIALPPFFSSVPEVRYCRCSFSYHQELKMAVQSKAEINLRRLLAQCETMANEIKSNDGRINWRLEKVSYPFIINNV